METKGLKKKTVFKQFGGRQFNQFLKIFQLKYTVLVSVDLQNNGKFRRIIKQVLGHKLAWHFDESF